MPNNNQRTTSQNVEDQNKHSEEVLDTKRRAFLKKSAFVGGLSVPGVASLSSLASACNPPSGNYSEKDITHFMTNKAQVKDGKCSNNFNSGKRIDAGGTLVYWDTKEWGDGTYDHHFSTQAHAEHFDENYSNCNWYHSQGLTQQRWLARDTVSGNEFNTPSSWTGVFPPVNSDGNFYLTNTAFTGVSLLVSYAWPTSSPMVAAAEIVYALSQDHNRSSPGYWDAKLNWDYGGDYKDCLSHSVTYDVSGNKPKTDHTVKESYWSSHLYTEFSHHEYVDSSNSLSSPSMTTSSTGDNEIAAPRKDIQKGDIIHPDNDRKVRVVEKHTHTKKQPGAPKEKVNKKRYKEKNPVEYEEKGAPEYILHLPATSKTTALTGVILD